MQQENYRLLEYWITKSAAETFKRGEQIAAALAPGDVLIFTGNLGSGKTTLIQGICAGLSVTTTVTSPTFTLINEYRGRLPVYHFDFYRLHSDFELYDLGLDEYLYGEGVCLVEWPELIAGWLPVQHTRLHLSHGIAAAELTHQLWDETRAGELIITNDVRLIEVYRHEPARH